MSEQKANEPKPSLIKKLAEVMAAVERIPKRGKNEFHGYNFATEADILDVIRGELAKRSVMVIPRINGHTRTEAVRESKNGVRKTFISDVEMTFAFMDGDSGEVIEVPWKGCGEDSGEKGLYKAITGADKYVFMKTFLISTGDDPELDKRKPKDTRVHADARRRDTSPAYPTVTADQAQTVRNLIAETGIAKADALAEVRKACGVAVASAAEIPADKFAAVIAALEKARPVTA